MIRIVSVKFCTAGRHYHFNCNDLDLHPGDIVIVETARGRALATVVTPPRELSKDKAAEDTKSVLRIATEEDYSLKKKFKGREKEAFEFCQNCISERGMGMKLVRAEYLFDGSKIVFYFTADGRVDFRELVKDLAHQFHTRIEMKQIGVRDEAKLTGGIGICGRELCCCTFLREFSPVSVKMAKEQGLALNPSKISGQCGRLLCCLSYEFGTYCSLKQKMPKTGEQFVIDGKKGVVVDLNIINQKITLRMEDNQRLTITLLELREGHAKAPPSEIPDMPVKTRKPKPQAPPQPAATPFSKDKRSRRKPTGKKSTQKPAQKQGSKPAPKTAGQTTAKPGPEGSRTGQKTSPKPGQTRSRENQPVSREVDGAPKKKRSRPRRRPKKTTDNNGSNNEPRS